MISPLITEAPARQVRPPFRKEAGSFENCGSRHKLSGHGLLRLLQGDRELPAMLIAQTGAAALPSELVAARIGDVSLVEERGLLGLSRRGKIDQHGRSLAIWAKEAKRKRARPRPAWCSERPARPSRRRSITRLRYCFQRQWCHGPTMPPRRRPVAHDTTARSRSG